MTRREKEDVLVLLDTLKTDAEMAISGTWDKSKEGFEYQVVLIDDFVKNLNKQDESTNRKTK